MAILGIILPIYTIIDMVDIFFAGKSADGIAYKSLAKNFQNIFFSIAFVCIGLDFLWLPYCSALSRTDVLN